MTSRRRRILFFAEAVTLAHVARPAVLAGALDPAAYDVHFACADRFPVALGGTPLQRWPLQSISTDRFLRALANGTPLYDYKTLARYVEADRALIQQVRPDIVVGDFRLSLSVSARVERVPYVTLTNAYWSPYAEPRFPFPEHPLGRIVGVRLASALFRLVRPLVLAHHAGALNRLRARHGLSRLGGLREAYTDADLTLYADLPELVPTFGRPPFHEYLGPVLWSPPIPLPGWWNDLPEDRQKVYVTLGSSGETRLLPSVLEGLADLPVVALVATAGRSDVTGIPGKVWVSDYLAGADAARASAVVIGNGGSPTTYQALAEGVPVLGLPSNMDQYLNMGYVAEAGAGLLLRSGHATPGSVRAAVSTLLGQDAYRQTARRLSERISSAPATRRFPEILAGWPG